MSDHQPPTLTAALDAGIDLAEWPRVGYLAERALTEIAAESPGERARSAAEERAWRDAALDQGDQLTATACQWCAELADDLTGDLTKRFRAAIPDQLRAECDADLARARSPHPLTTGDTCEAGAGWWKCSHCGAAFGAGHAALTVGAQPGWSQLDYPIRYCAQCVTSAASALDVLDSERPA